MCTLSLIFLFWLTWLLEALLLCASLAKFRSSCTWAFLTPSLHNWATISLYSFQEICACLPYLWISFLPFSLTKKSQLNHAGLLPSFPDFLQLGIAVSCALWEAFLRSCQLWSAPFSLRTVSQGSILTNSLKSWNFAFLKFRILTPCLTHIPQECKLLSTGLWSLQHRLTPVLIGVACFCWLPQIQYHIPSGKAVYGWGTHPPCIPGVCWVSYSSSCFLPRCCNCWSPPAGQEPVSMAPCAAGAGCAAHSFTNRLPLSSKKPNKICTAAPQPWSSKLSMVIYQRGGSYANLEFRRLCMAQVAVTPGIMGTSNPHNVKVCAPIKRTKKYGPGQPTVF